MVATANEVDPVQKPVAWLHIDTSGRLQVGSVPTGQNHRQDEVYATYTYARITCRDEVCRVLGSC